jgi:nicotinate-nucleotide adenylyltransferase
VNLFSVPGKRIICANGISVNIGILGGTFNPPHLGHLRLAEEVADRHGLDRVLFIPSFIPPHKITSTTAPSEDRLAMTMRACRGNSRFEVSDLEITLKTTSYTVNTLEILSKQIDHETFFIMGTDSLRDIHTWKEYSRLFLLSHFIVVKRPGTDFAAAWESMPQEVRECFRRQGDILLHEESGKRLIPSEVAGLDISATRIRELLAHGRSIRYLIPESVWRYILRRKLYGT